MFHFCQFRPLRSFSPPQVVRWSRPHGRGSRACLASYRQKESCSLSAKSLLGATNWTFSFRLMTRKQSRGSYRVLPQQSSNSCRPHWGAPILRQFLFCHRIPNLCLPCLRNLRHCSFSIRMNRNRDQHNPRFQKKSVPNGPVQVAVRNPRGGWAAGATVISPRLCGIRDEVPSLCVYPRRMCRGIAAC